MTGARDGEGPGDDPLIERIEHVGASPEGSNSTYVLPDRGIVVDPGPPGERAWETLTAGLRAAGLPLEAVEAVVVTHWHADHAGSAPRLADAADAELSLHAEDAPLVGEYEAARRRRLDRDARRLREWGVPESVVDAVTTGDEPSPMPPECPVRSVADGDEVGVGEVLHTPGHTSGHIALAVGDALFLGDAVLPTYTPNVGGSDTRTEDALGTYLDTLDRLVDRGVGADAEALRPYPGHGASVDLAARIDTIRSHHADRVRDAVAALPGPNSPDPGATPWAVARDLFGEMREIHAKMGAGEAAAHLAFAADLGLAERVGSDPDRYRRTAREPADEALARIVRESRYR